MGFLSLSIKEQRSLISIYKKKNRNIFSSYMTEQMSNEIVESVVNALKVRRMIINEKEVFDLMYRHENIYQIVMSKFCSEKKARFIIRELKEMSGKKESVTKKSIYPLPDNYVYARGSKIKNRI